MVIKNRNLLNLNISPIPSINKSDDGYVSESSPLPTPNSISNSSHTHKNTIKKLYSIRSLLKQSNHAQIYKAIDRQTGQKVILKRYLKACFETKELYFTELAHKICPEYCLPILFKNTGNLDDKYNNSSVSPVPTPVSGNFFTRKFKKFTKNSSNNKNEESSSNRTSATSKTESSNATAHANSQSTPATPIKQNQNSKTNTSLQFSDSKYLTFVMPQYGMSLYDFMLHRGTVLSIAEAKFVFKQVLECLTKLQNYGLYHLDIKEENILIDPETFKIKLIDFGCSSELPIFNKKIVGSKEFCAPEIYCGESNFNNIRKHDVWSLGVCIISAMTGNTPYDDIRQVITGEENFKIASQFESLFSEDLKEILLLMLDLDYERRISLKKVLKNNFFR